MTDTLDFYIASVIERFHQYRKRQGFDHVTYLSSSDLKEMLEAAKNTVKAIEVKSVPLTYENCPCRGCVRYREELKAFEAKKEAELLTPTQKVCSHKYTHDGEHCSTCGVNFNYLSDPKK